MLPSVPSPLLREALFRMLPSILNQAISSQSGDRETLQVLLYGRAKQHYDGLDPLADGSALEEAVKKNDTQVIQMLLAAANNIRETASRFGSSLYLVAVLHGHKDLIVDR